MVQPYFPVSRPIARGISHPIADHKGEGGGGVPANALTSKGGTTLTSKSGTVLTGKS